MYFKLGKCLCVLGLLCFQVVLAQNQSEQVVKKLEVLKKASLPAVDKLNQVFELSWQYTMLEAPEFATYTGFPGQNDRWTNLSSEAVARRRRDQEFLIRILSGIDVSDASRSDQLNYQLFRLLIEQNVEESRFPNDLLPLNQMNGVHINMAQILTMMPLKNKSDTDAYLSRLEAIPTVLTQTKLWLEKGLAAGVTPPKITLRDVPAQIRSQIPDNPEESPLLQPIAALKDRADAAEVKRKAIAIYISKIKPAFSEFHTFMVQRYIPGARETIGLGDLPNGKAWYRFRVRQKTTTDLSPEAIHQIGLDEVKRIRGQMEMIIEKTNFQGDFHAFTTFLRTDPQFYFTEKEDLLRAYRDIAKRADAKLVELFSVLPRLPYGVIPVPAYQEKTATTAYYNPGSIEVGRPGYFFANTYDLKSRPKWEMEALTLHEGVPGHHLQIALGQEMKDVPLFRKFSFTTAFVEGWGLYSESLGESMGFYQDPYAKFGQLTYEMWRAIRLVVDTGMHYLGWSRQQAIDFFKSNTGKAEHDIVVEVDRYIVWPGQALAYKIGELKIKQLRAFAEKELGEAFDIREFHDEVLGAGAVPLSVLQTRIHDWVSKMKPS